MKSNKTLIAVIVALLVLAVCACTATAAFFAWSYGDQMVQWIRDAARQAEGQAPLVEPQAETPIPVGQAIDLSSLFAPVWESRADLRDSFFVQPVKDSVLAQGAMDGLKTFLGDKSIDLTTLQAPESAPSAQTLSDQAGTPSEAAADFASFWDAWRNVEFGLPSTADISYQDLMRASLRSMVAALGEPHTIYEDPFELRQSDLSLQGEYEGIGAFVDTDTKSGYVTIIAPMKDSPAEAAGLQAGDEVIAVDGADMTGVDGNVVISHILGPQGTTVVLTIRREGTTEPFDVSIVRSHIVVPSVESKMLDHNIGYIQLFQFGSNSADEFHRALQELMAQNPSGLIVDLRNNGGGYLDTAVDITSEFLKDGVVLYEEYNDGSRNTYDVRSGGLATDIPMVVLVNEGTASASEIFSGALQDYNRAQLVGVTSYGKGSVQISRMLANDQGALRITIAHWLTPNERQIDGVGLEPDVVVGLTQDDIDAKRDPQLEKAIELLTQ